MDSFRIHSPRPTVKLLGSAMLLASVCGAAGLLPDWRLFDHTIVPGGAAGFLIAGLGSAWLNSARSGGGAGHSSGPVSLPGFDFTLAKLNGWLSPVIAVLQRIRDNWRALPRTSPRSRDCESGESHAARPPKHAPQRREARLRVRSPYRRNPAPPDPASRSESPPGAGAHRLRNPALG